MGRPGQAKQAGIEQRKKTLLVEYEKKDKAGALVDRRFGENDPTMSLEERMLARFTKERQRSSKGTMFNLEDDDELTHYGQSLSKLDDFDNVGLQLDEDEEDDAGQIDAATVRATHFQGFSDEEDGDHEDGPPRKKTKAEVMAEVIAKSKEHKYARQMQREQDENTRHLLDEDFDSIRGILFSQAPDRISPPPIPSTTAPSALNSVPVQKPATDKDYDAFVHELAMDRRAQPKDRTKTEEELALEEKEALELAEKKRLRRMMGMRESDDEDEGRGKRKRGGDDLDDDFLLDEDTLEGLGAGLAQPKDEDNDDDEDEEVDSGEDGPDSESGSDEEESEGDEEDYGPSDEGEEAEEGSVEALAPTQAKIKVKTKRSKEIPFTFPCPTTHDELLQILDGIDDSHFPTVIERIRKLHHPSLHPDNKTKLQALIGVLLDHALYVASGDSPSATILDTIASHTYSLTKTYPIPSAEFFVSKLNLMQKNLTRGLQNPLDEASKTFPGAPELVLLRILGATWSTSDMKHPVVSPAKYLMGAYLGLSRVRSMTDVVSGLYLCSLFMHYEQLSKRYVPEAINFLVQSLLLLVPSAYPNARKVPGYFPLPDFDLLESKLRIKPKKVGSLTPRAPKIFELLDQVTFSEQDKLDLFSMTLELLKWCAEMYKPLDGFIELYDPILQILHSIQSNCRSRLSDTTQSRLDAVVDHVSRLLKFARQARRPLFLQDHKPIPIATYIPKFDAHSSSYIRNHDPDAERAQLAKLKAQHRKEKKGAMRELRKDNRFLAGVQQERQEKKDQEYKARMAKAFAGLESERAEQRKEEKEKRRAKRRAGK